MAKELLKKYSTIKDKAEVYKLKNDKTAAKKSAAAAAIAEAAAVAIAEAVASECSVIVVNVGGIVTWCNATAFVKSGIITITLDIVMISQLRIAFTYVSFVRRRLQQYTMTYINN